MSHVKIHLSKDGGRVEVDGIDLAAHILAEDFSVEFASELGQPSKVRMTLAADVVDIDLPVAVVEAIR